MKPQSLIEVLHCFVADRYCETRLDAAHAAGTGLAGKTFAVKDLIDVAGEPTGAGCATPRVASAPRSAAVVERLLTAGAVYVGKTHTVQMAFGGWGTNTCTGAPRNPWDAQAHRIAGGSSSGSAVAVAAGLVDFALGTDTGGSVRIPAALCGIVGLKPSWGFVSMQGVLPLAPSLDSIGTLAGNVATAADALATIAGRQAGTSGERLESLEFRSLGPPDLVADEDVIASYRAAIAKLEAAGGRVTCRPLPLPPGDYVQPTGCILGYEAWQSHGDFVRSGACLDAGVQGRFLAASAIGRDEYRAALERRAEHRSSFERWFDGADILLTPTTPRTAVRLEAVDETDYTLARFTRMANYLDLCGLTLPCGLDGSGLPIGLQLLARSGGEDMLIAAALALEPLIVDAGLSAPLHQRNARIGDPQ